MKTRFAPGSGPGQVACHCDWPPIAPPGGFTLLELLVVIGAVGMLAGLLLPALRSAGARAASVVCRHHLRQWGLGTHLYLAAHDDFLPPEGFPNPTDRQTNRGWYIQLPREMALPRYHDLPWRTNAAAPTGPTPWLCPSNRRRSNGRNLFHYCLNQHVDGTSNDEVSVRLVNIPDPAGIVWLFDTKNLPAVGGWSFVHTNIHSGGAQFLFLDGHVTWFRNTAYWEFNTGRGRTNNPEIAWFP